MPSFLVGHGFAVAEKAVDADTVTRLRAVVDSHHEQMTKGGGG